MTTPKKRTRKKVVPKTKEVEANDDFEVSNSDEDKMAADMSPPNITDPGWTQYVLDHLVDDEMFEGNPKGDGLRRLVEKFIGPIVAMETDLKTFPTGRSDENSATAVCRITIQRPGSNVPIVVSQVADATLESCPYPFSKFLSAIAETRALGRCYRAALRLKNVVTSDELAGEKVLQNTDRIQDSALKIIEKKCKDLDLNVQKVFWEGIDKDNKPAAKDYSEEDGVQVLDKIHSLQKKLETKDNAKVPEAIKGYDGEWRSYF